MTRKLEGIFIVDEAILSIPVEENDEPLINLLDFDDLIYGPSPEIPNNTDYTKMRSTIFQKLKLAETRLPKGVRFCIYEAYRSLDLQQIIFDTRYNKVKKIHPHWTPELLFKETVRMVSPVKNLDKSINIPPHSTGAAIDIYLIDNNHNYLDMGIHPRDWMEDVEGIYSVSNARCVSSEAKRNRQIMAEALESVGFVNYFYEYWHWSYGDKYWAYYNNKPCAIYNTWSN